MIKKFYFIYQWFIFIPLMALATFITASVTILMCRLFDNRIWGFYPAKIWSRFTCYFTFVKVEVIGRENIKKNQSYVFVANHQSLFDIFAIYGWLNIPFKWIMKQELANIPVFGNACKSAGHIFISRTYNRATIQSINEAKKLLTNGLSVVIFPEGSRTQTGEIGSFKRGAFQISTDLKLPIIPITIKGAFEVMPKTTYNITPGTIKIIIHPEIDPTTYTENQNDLTQMVRKSITDDFL